MTCNIIWSKDVNSLLVCACVQAAEEGVARTSEMKEAGAGRASYVHSSELTQADPGAMAVALAMAAIYKQLAA